MLIKNYKPAHFDCCVNLMRDDLMQDSVFTFTNQRKYTAKISLCKSVFRRTGNRTKRKLERAKK